MTMLILTCEAVAWETVSHSWRRGICQSNYEEMVAVIGDVYKKAFVCLR